MGAEETSKVAQLVDYFISLLSEVADEEDWKESEGWVGKWTIVGPQGITRIYEIRRGKFYPAKERERYTGQVEMSEDTFIDLVDGALDGKGEETFRHKYAISAIRYRGDQWIVDSERFMKVLSRLGKVPITAVAKGLGKII